MALHVAPRCCLPGPRPSLTLSDRALGGRGCARAAWPLGARRAPPGSGCATPWARLRDARPRAATPFAASWPPRRCWPCWPNLGASRGRPLSPVSPRRAQRWLAAPAVGGRRRPGWGGWSRPLCAPPAPGWLLGPPSAQVALLWLVSALLRARPPPSEEPAPAGRVRRRGCRSDLPLKVAAGLLAPLPLGLPAAAAGPALLVAGGVPSAPRRRGGAGCPSCPAGGSAVVAACSRALFFSCRASEDAAGLLRVFFGDQRFVAAAVRGSVLAAAVHPAGRARARGPL